MIANIIFTYDTHTPLKSSFWSAAKILDLAIRGKLVPHDPSDEPASELLKRVAAERTALVKAVKLKAGKADPVIFRGSDRPAYETRSIEMTRIYLRRTSTEQRAIVDKVIAWWDLRNDIPCICRKNNSAIIPQM